MVVSRENFARRHLLLLLAVGGIAFTFIPQQSTCTLAAVRAIANLPVTDACRDGCNLCLPKFR